MIAKQSTYCTILTPPGTGAIAMVRVCGPDAHTIVSKSWRSRKGRSLSRDGRDRLHLGRFMDGEEVVDDVIVVYSDINGNRIVDICAHGGTRIVERILRTLHDSGAPLRENAQGDTGVWPSDNMIDAELVQLMSQCKTHRALRFLSRQRRELVSRLERAAATVEANPAACKAGFDEMIAGYLSAKILIDGATVALIGPPNSGKSTLFNRLIGRSAAIASPQAGTTRDWVARQIEMRGIAVTLVDTAGSPDSANGPIRTLGSLERRAIEAGQGMAEKADLCVLLLDGSVEMPTADLENWRESVSRTPLMAVANKSDCRASSFPESVGLGLGRDKDPVTSVSARTGAGLEEFVERIVAQLVPIEKFDEMPCFCTRRQVDEAVRVKAACDESPKAARRIILRQLIAG